MFVFVFCDLCVLCVLGMLGWFSCKRVGVALYKWSERKKVLFNLFLTKVFSTLPSNTLIFLFLFLFYKDFLEIFYTFFLKRLK